MAISISKNYYRASPIMNINTIVELAKIKRSIWSEACRGTLLPASTYLYKRIIDVQKEIDMKLLYQTIKK